MVWLPVSHLAGNPSALGTLLGASALTTLILGFAFVASTDMVPGPRPVAGVGHTESLIMVSPGR
jgi:hypothetical protein